VSRPRRKDEGDMDEPELLQHLVDIEAITRLIRIDSLGHH
jgi:hypothetical protein